MEDEQYRGFDAAYRAGRVPWDVGGPQPAVVRLADAGAFDGLVLDAGCGSGDNALFLASRGLEVVGVDAAPTAIQIARGKAAERRVAIDFAVGDVRRLKALGRTFDTVLDSGLFHTLGDDDRGAYEASLAGVVRPGGRLQLLCFSDEEPWHGGPRLISQAEISGTFSARWRVVEVVPERFAVQLVHKEGARAWRATIERVGT